MSRVVRRIYGLGPLKTYWREVRTKLRGVNLGYGGINLFDVDGHGFKYKICWDTTDENAEIVDALRVIWDVLNAYAPGCRIVLRGQEKSNLKGPWERETLWKWRHCMRVIISC